MSSASLLLTEAQNGPKEFNTLYFIGLLFTATPLDLLATNKDAQTLHMLLAYHGHEMAFNTLCQRCSPNVFQRESDQGRVLAHFAIQHADDASRRAKARILDSILSSGGSPDVADYPVPLEARRSLLDYAINEGCPACVRVLLKHGATVTAQAVEAARINSLKTNGDGRHIALRKQVHKLLARAFSSVCAAA